MKKSESLALFHLALALTAVTAAGCSLQSPKARRIQINLPEGGFSKSASRLAPGAARAGNAFLTDPTLIPSSLDDFTCFALNVTGESIPRNTEIKDCFEPGMPEPGLFFGSVKAPGGMLEAMVPQGEKRTFQLLGFMSKTGCPAVDDIIHKRVDDSQLGDAYEIGRTTADVFGDATVQIKALWDPLAPAKYFCDKNDGGSENDPYFTLEGNNTVVAGTCETYQLKHYINGTLTVAASDQTVNLDDGAGSGVFYEDNACDPLNSPVMTSATLEQGQSSKTIYYLNTKAESVSLRADHPTLNDASYAVQINPAGATKLVFTQSPLAIATVGTNLSPDPTVEVRDTYGNAIPDWAGAIAISSTTGSGCTGSSTGSLSGTTTVWPNAGVSIFSNLSHSAPESIYLKATSGVLTEACSGNIAVNAAPAVVAGELTGVTQITSGTNHTCAVIGSSGVKCWGANPAKQLGDGTTTERTKAVAVPGVTNIYQIGSGEAHTCVVLSDQTVKCWGKGVSGQLGDGMNSNQGSPVTASGLSGVEMVVGGGIANPITSHTCVAMSSDGTVRCWGGNGSGQRGTGDTSGASVPPTSGISGLSGILHLAAGTQHTCAVTSTGGVKCWGLNDLGQLGDQSYITRTSPVQVVVSGNTPLNGVQKVALGHSHSCALKTDNTVWCWGADGYSQIGNTAVTNNTSVAVKVDNVISAVDIFSGWNHTCAILSNNTLKCWGRDDAGMNMSTGGNGLTGVLAGSAGAMHTCALISGGTVKCWGAGSQGKLGNGSTLDSATPVAVQEM